MTQSQLEKRVRTEIASWGARHIAELMTAYMSITQDGIAVKELFPDEFVEVESKS